LYVFCPKFFVCAVKYKKAYRLIGGGVGGRVGRDIKKRLDNLRRIFIAGAESLPYDLQVMRFLA
jgi:hypothetical protein